jgi:hypothetical protein
MFLFLVGEDLLINFPPPRAKRVWGGIKGGGGNKTFFLFIDKFKIIGIIQQHFDSVVLLRFIPL